LLSLTQEAFCVDGNCSGWPGYGILAFGALGLVTFHPANLTWIANPLLFIAWGLLWAGNGMGALKSSAVALLIALFFLLMPSVVVSEGGMPGRITGLRLGYFLWLASMGTAMVAANFAYDPDEEADLPAKSADKPTD
jgi:hypothetical protein